MKNLLIIAGVVADAALIVLSLSLMLAGYLAWGAVALLSALGLVFAAARFWLRTPPPAPADPAPTEWFVWDEELEAGLSDVEQQMLRNGCVPVPDPVDVHQAQMAAVLEPTRPLSILRQPDWPNVHLIQPRPRPRYHGGGPR